MKLLIKTASDDYALLVDTPNAAAAAGLLAGAVLVKCDNRWDSKKRWSRAEENCSIEFIEDSAVQEYTDREKDLKKQLEDKNTQWYKEYAAKQAAEKRTKELEEQIALLQSVTVCTKEEPPVFKPESSETGDVFTDAE